MSEDILLVTKLLVVTLVAWSVLCLPSLFTYRTWMSSASNKGLHVLSALYATICGMWIVGGLEYAFHPNSVMIFWFAVFWALSKNILKHFPISHPGKFYLSTCLGRFAVLAIYEVVMLFGLKDNEMNRGVLAYSMIVFIFLVLIGSYNLPKTIRAENV